MNKDFYKILGVAEDAEPAEIKRVYRRLAKKYHPDRNKGDPQAEAKFKEVSAAYETLSDTKKREEYDLMRRYGAFAGGPQGGFANAGGSDPFAGGFDFSKFMPGGQGGSRTFRFSNLDDMGSLEDLLGSFAGGLSGAEDMFGGQRAQRTRRGRDVATTISIPFREAVYGVTKSLRPIGSGEKLRLRIPAGIEDGGKVRLRGQGQPGLYGGRNGDLIITVRVMPDKDFERKGNDIYSSVEISFIEAINGCKKQARTLTRVVSLTIPPGTQPGTKLRLKGMGLGVGGVSGDQYVEIEVTIPKTLTDKQKRLLDEWEE